MDGCSSTPAQAIPSAAWAYSGVKARFWAASSKAGNLQLSPPPPAVGHRARCSRGPVGQGTSHPRSARHLTKGHAPTGAWSALMPTHKEPRTGAQPAHLEAKRGPFQLPPSSRDQARASEQLGPQVGGQLHLLVLLLLLRRGCSVCVRMGWGRQPGVSMGWWAARAGGVLLQGATRRLAEGNQVLRGCGGVVGRGVLRLRLAAVRGRRGRGGLGAARGCGCAGAGRRGGRASYVGRARSSMFQGRLSPRMAGVVG